MSDEAQRARRFLADAEKGFGDTVLAENAALLGVGHAILAIHEELVKRNGLAPIVPPRCSGSNVMHVRCALEEHPETEKHRNGQLTWD